MNYLFIHRILCAIILFALLACNSKKETSDVISGGTTTTKAPILGFNIPSSSSSDDDTPSFSIRSTSGFFNAGTTFKVYEDANCSSLAFTGTVPNFSEWVYFTTNLPNLGPYTFTVKYVDFLGIDSACSNSITYTVLPPPTPTSITLLSQASPSSNPNPRVRVNGTNGNEVEIYLNGTCTGTPLIKSTSNTMTLPPLASGTHQIYALTVSSAGRKSSCLASPLSYQSTQSFTLKLTVGASKFGDQVSGMESADIDGDGNVDFATSLTTGSCGSASFGNGSGTYSSVSLTCQYEGRSIKIEDLNGDGKKDILLGNSDSTLYLFTNNGSRTFTRTTLATLGLGFNAIKKIDTFDVNNDGTKDIIFAMGSTADIYIMLANGDGTFQTPLDATGTAPISDYVIADVDNDGTVDIVEKEAAKFVIYEHAGSGSFTQTAEVTTDTSYDVFHVNDLNGDNYPELIYGSSNNLKVMMNDALGGFAVVNTLSYPNSISGEFSKVEDIDGDNKSDLLIGDLLSRQLIVLRGAGDGSFLFPLLYPNGNSGFQQKFMIMDYDGNGLKDVIGAKVILQTP